jgi:hypothetical protein
MNKIKIKKNNKKIKTRSFFSLMIGWGKCSPVIQVPSLSLPCHSLGP